MGLLKNIFAKKEETIKSYNDFWNWFQKKEREFYKVVKQGDSIDNAFLDKIAPKLDAVKNGFFYLAGMYNDNTAELIITADGTIKNIVFVEELIASAPKINGWRFTALKPALDIKDVGIEMDGYTFNKTNLFFFPNDDKQFPDEIDISIVYTDFKLEDKDTISNGIYLFIDNFLGELNFAETIDNLNICEAQDLENELIPIEKLKDYLTWRQKEFVEKYDKIKYVSKKDNFEVMEAKLQSGAFLVAVFNTQLLNWDCKVSYPWVINIEILYDGTNNNGMPNDKTYKMLSELEDEILADLKDFVGILYIGRQTAKGVREIYLTCKNESVL